jgi:hypothetical protein
VSRRRLLRLLFWITCGSNQECVSSAGLSSTDVMPSRSLRTTRHASFRRRLTPPPPSEQIAIIKQTKFAVCRAKDPAVAIVDEFLFPMDVDSHQVQTGVAIMAPE